MLVCGGTKLSVCSVRPSLGAGLFPLAGIPGAVGVWCSIPGGN